MNVHALLNKYAKYFGLLTMVIEWSLLIFLYVNYPTRFSESTPLSDFLGFAATRYIFIVGFSLASITFWVFVRWHLAARYKTSSRVFGLSLLCLIVALLIPYKDGTSHLHLIHILGAMLFAVGFYVGVLLLGLQNKDRYLRRASVAITVGLALILLIAAMINLEAILYIELAIGLFGHLWILFISIYSMKTSRQDLTTR